MADQKLTDAELKFAEIIWANAPLKSSELVRLCEAALKWKKSTTYTMLKRLEEKGIFRNEAGLVIVSIGKEDFFSEQSKRFVSETFDGSLPKFVAAFTRTKKLSKTEIEELYRLIEAHEGDS
ncbi:MAG: CopY family transcriptional regulator [Bacillota bacterium]|jgi:predicted transcriptional regulator|nr:CopY family transcriptional regulator [Bacillota bacterium]